MVKRHDPAVFRADQIRPAADPIGYQHGPSASQRLIHHQTPGFSSDENKTEHFTKDIGQGHLALIEETQQMDLVQVFKKDSALQFGIELSIPDVDQLGVCLEAGFQESVQQLKWVLDWD